MTEQATKPKRVRKKSQLTLHTEGECGCSRSTNPNKCVYQEFLDGWSFTPDVGNGQKRGEVFTPRFIVDKMIVDVGLFPDEGVYHSKYTDATREEAADIVAARLVEPAVGTANFLSTVLWHKIQYAFRCSVDDDQNLDINEYHTQLLTAVSSVYAFDIDAGNVEVARRRLLAEDIPLNDKKAQDAWRKELAKAVTTDGDHAELIDTVVVESLDNAQEHWARFFNADEGGVVQQLYRAHTGHELPTDLYTHARKLIDTNVKIFNGIVREDTVEDDFICPGWEAVHWNWWNVKPQDDGTFKLSSKKVSLAQQMLEGEIEQLQHKADRLKAEKLVEKMDGLFPVEDWASDKDRLDYNKILKQISAAQKDLQKVS